MADFQIVTNPQGNSNKVEILIKSAGVMDAPDEKTAATLKRVAKGSVVYTADLSFMAMKDPEGVWKEIGGDGEWTL